MNRHPSEPPDWEPLEPDAGSRPAQKRHRLPSEKTDFRVLAAKGYFFCLKCERVTEEASDGGCRLCGSYEIEWQEPVFKEGQR